MSSHRRTRRLPRPGTRAFEPLESRTLLSAAAALNDPATPAVTVIDLLGVYTQKTLQAAGSIETLVRTLGDELADANTALANSQVPVRLRWAAIGWVDYTASSSYETDVTRLSRAGDGFLDEVGPLRNTVGADLVVLVNELGAGQTIGIATLLEDVAVGNPEGSAFIVISHKHLRQFVLAHEVGHTLGAGHALGEKNDDPEDPAGADYAHGYRFTGTDGKHYRDIMAYEPGIRVPYFANPDVTYKGVPTGESTTHNVARALRESAPLVAQYRAGNLLTQIDRFDASVISGWAVDPRALDGTVSLQLEVDGKPVATFTADKQRTELWTAFGAPMHGFAYTLPRLADGNHAVALYATDAAGARIMVAARVVTAQPLLFDETYYLQHNPDVAAAVERGQLTAWGHFTGTGKREFRNPSAYFDAAYYLAENPDVAAAWAQGNVASPWDHYYRTGQDEARRGSPYFDEAFYRNSNPDIAQAIATGALRSGIEHFLAAGQFENRNPVMYFYGLSYQGAMPAGNPSPYAHFLKSGNAAQWNPSPWFDPVVYLAANPDVAAAVVQGAFISAFDHFLRTGWRESRNFSSAYSESAYLALHADVADAVKKGLFTNGFEHYLLAGRFEGRHT